MTIHRLIAEVLGDQHPDTAMENIVERGFTSTIMTDNRPRGTYRTNWTVLDEPPNSPMSLVGLPDGRTAVVASMTGRWPRNMFIPSQDLNTMPPNLKTYGIVYRHTYDTSRRVTVAFDSRKGRWYSTEGVEQDATDVGRPSPVLDEVGYEQALRKLAESIVRHEVEGEDPDERIDRIWGVLKMVARHSYQRGYHELGFGWFS